MKGPRWTEDQLTAITARDSNLLVAAAAGAGKTAVLVERIIRQVTNPDMPVDVDKLLVVTFTKAAAAEMRERIAGAVAREIIKNPGFRRLRRQVNLLNRASITTLHSFCLEITRSYFYLLDLDPGFRVADETEGALLRMEVLDEIFEERYVLGDQGFLDLVDGYGGQRDDGPLKEIIFKLYNFAVSMPWPEKWLQSIVELYRLPENIGLDRHPWGKALLEWVSLEMQGCRIKLKRALALSEAPGGPEPYRENLQEDIALIDDLLVAVGNSWQAAYQAFNLTGFKKLKSCRSKDLDENLKERVKNLRDQVKKKTSELREQVFSRSPSSHIQDLGNLTGTVAEITGLVAEFRERYGRVKGNRALVDFADLEHYCLKVLLDPASTPEKLLPSPVAEELRKNYHEVLVDEYQDINAVQETILQMVSRQGEAQPNLFMVGDVKQSIYRFRLAEPALFMEKYLSYTREPGETNRGIDLSQNFRSRREVVDGVNFIFRQIMTGRVGEMEYDRKAELVCGAQYVSDLPSGGTPLEIEVHLLEKQSADAVPGQVDIEEESGEEPQTSGQREEILSALQREARLIAQRIKALVGSEGKGQFMVFDRDKGGYRPICLRDIVVLMRATREGSAIFLEEFQKAGIPGYADLSAGYFDAVEVETMMALLRVIDNPRQDIPLAGILRSPVVGLSAEELAAVKTLKLGSDFFDALLEAREAGPFEEGGISSSLAEKVRNFLSRLDEWRTLARRGSLADLIWYLYDQTGYYAYVGAMPGGVQRQANLRALHDRARQYESTSFRGLFRFLRFVEKFQETGQDLGAARALGENEEVVRIISIHKSKGLEFPVVFVAGMGRQFNLADLRQKAMLHKELGLGLPVVDPELRLIYPSLAHLAIKRRLGLELLAEEMRVLYVALTRAREKLILVGTVKSLDKAAQEWCQNVNHDLWGLPETDLAGALCCLDWLGPALVRHRDGTPLRTLTGLDFSPYNPFFQDPSRWEILCHGEMPELTPAIPKKSVEDALWDKVRAMEPVAASHGSEEVVHSRLAWVYPYSGAVLKAAKVAVSEVKRKFGDLRSGEDETLSLRVKVAQRPRFLQQGSGLTATEKGTAMHLVMQHLNLRGALTPGDIRSQVKVMVDRELLTPEQAQVIDIEAIGAFFAGPLGQRLLEARAVKRELPFTLGLPAAQIYPDIPSDHPEKVVVQGVIDCLLEEEGGIVLIDYKTDFVGKETDIARITREYRGQMNIYALAIESSLEQKVKEKYLYLFSTGQAVPL